MKKSQVFVIVILVLFMFSSCCAQDIITITGTEQGSSNLTWVGKFYVEKIELNDDVILKEDFVYLGWSTEQYIALNKDFTGEFWFDGYPEAQKIHYSYDLAHKNGTIFWQIQNSSVQFAFQIEQDMLIAEIQGATWIFKKVS